MLKPDRISYSIESDVIRIIAGFFVVLIHTTDLFLSQSSLIGGSSWWLLNYFNILGKVAVPFFIMLSGFLLVNKEKKTSANIFFKRRMKRIFLPFVFWVIIYFWWMAFWGKYTITPVFVLKSLLSASLLHLYFIPIIAELYLLTPLFWKYFLPLSQNRQFIVVLSFLVFGAVLNRIGNIYFWLDAEHNPIALFTIFLPYVGYYLAGSFIRRYKFSTRDIGIAGVIVLLSFIFIVIARGHDVNSHAVDYLNPLMILLSLGFFVVLKLFFSLFNLSTYTSSIPTVRVISSTVFGIFLVHIIVRDVLGILPFFNPYSIHTPILLFIGMYVLLGFFLSFAIVAGIQRIPYVSAIFG